MIIYFLVLGFTWLEENKILALVVQRYCEYWKTYPDDALI